MWAAPQDVVYPVLADHPKPATGGQPKSGDLYFGDTNSSAQAFRKGNFASAWAGEETNLHSMVKQETSDAGVYKPMFVRSKSTSSASSLSRYVAVHPLPVINSKPANAAMIPRGDTFVGSKPIAAPVRVYRIRDEMDGRIISDVITDSGPRVQENLQPYAAMSGEQVREADYVLQRPMITRPQLVTAQKVTPIQHNYSGFGFATMDDKRILNDNKLGGTSNLSKLSYSSLNDQRLYNAADREQDRHDNKQNEEYCPIFPGHLRSEASLRLYKHPSLRSLQSTASSSHPLANIRHDKDQRLPQRIICTRHGERVDFVFGGNWTERAFDHRGNYLRINLNMPLHLPRKRNPRIDFIGDSPLTEVGMLQARLTGEALRHKAMYIHHCYASPSLRCVQTAHNILKGMGVEKIVPIKIEPGLFEFIGWYERGIPKFIKPSELSAFGYNIDLNYKPYLPVEKLNSKENYLDFYNRSFKTALNASERHPKRGCNILFSGHAATLEVCTRQLCGLPPRTYPEFNNVIKRVSYLGLNVCEKNPIDGLWSLVEPPIPPLQHSHNPIFDWKIMI